MWRDLSHGEWRQHKLNKLRGWLLVIIILNGLGLLFVPVAVWLLVSAPGSELSIAVPGRPIAADLFSFAVGLVGGLACLVAIFTRQYRTPEIYLFASVLSAVTMRSIEALWPDPERSGPVAFGIDVVLFVLFAVLPAAYLFLGARPNVVFKHRVRTIS